MNRDVQYDAIKAAFLDGELTYLDAIMRLEEMGYDPKVAERRVCEWEDEPKGI